MGEYAIRKDDGVRVKIGTCEDMYYLRFEDRHKVSFLSGNVDVNAEPEGNRYRLPFEDEDDVAVGEYQDYNRGLRLYRSLGVGAQTTHEDFSDSSKADEPGIIQLHHASGLLLNVPCYHGIKLPEVTLPMRAFWNGKTHAFVLSSLRALKMDDGGIKLLPVVRCQFCNGAWRYGWADVWEFIPYTMRVRLREYAGLGKVAA